MTRSQKNIILLCSLSLLFWGYYLQKLSPTVNLKDSGELITQAYTLGISHPPGYSLYALMANIFSNIPLGEIAFRVNAFSAFFGMIDIVLTALIIRLIGGGILGVLSGAGLVGSSMIFLEVSLVSEVYTLEIAVFLLALYLLIKRDNYRLVIFSISLMLAQHPKNLIYFVPLLLSYLLASRLASLRKGFTCVMLIVLLLSVNVYLPLRSVRDPELNWNRPASLSAVLFHLSGKEYSGRIFRPSKKQIVLFKDNFYNSFSSVFGWLGLIIALAGLVSLVRLKRFWLLSLLLIFSLVNIIFGIIALDPVEGFLAHFYLPAIFIVAIMLGAAITSLPELIYNSHPKFLSKQYLILMFFLCALVSFVLRQMPNSPAPDRRNDYIAYDFAANQLKCLVRDGALFAVGTRMTFPLKYLLFALNQRNDVLLIEGGFLKSIYSEWYLPSLPVPRNVFSDNNSLHDQLISFLLPRRPLYFAPLYASGYSPVKPNTLPKDGQMLNYYMGNWFVPKSNLQKAYVYLQRTGRKNFTLRSLYQKQYQPTSYENYVFRKYNQFFRRPVGLRK